MPPKKQTLAPPEDLTPLIQAFQNGTLTNAAVIAHVTNHVNKNYEPGVEKVRLGMEALERADPTATLAAIDHAQLYRQLADGALTDAHGTPIQLANAGELNGAKKVTETCAKIAYDDDMGVRRNFFRDPKATQKAVKAVTLAPPEDLTPLIQAFQNGTLTNAAVIAHVKNHVNKDYQPGVEKVRLGMEALERADPTATLAAIDHAQLYRQLADGALIDAHGTPIQLANAGELYGAKKVTETCAKIAYDDDMGVRRNFFRDPKATQKAVKAVTLAPPEDLTPLIQAFQNGTLTNAAVIAHVKNHVNAAYQPGVEKVRLGMEALERADPTATLAAIDHAQLYRQLADGALTDAHGTPIQLANADELYGAKKVTETCAKIAYDDDMGVRRNFFRDPKATQKAVKAVTLAPPEDLTPLIQAFQNGTLTNAAVIAHVKNHVNAAYQPGVEKVRLGMEALGRADPTATLAAIDHAQLYRQLADGALTDAHGTPIQLANAGELNGAKKVTETCAKIAYDDDMGVRRNFFRDPKATQKAVKAVTLAPPEDLTPLIQAFQNGTLTNAAVIAHVKNHVNKDYQPGVEKVRLGMEALERADPTATLAAIDHAQLYRQLADGALTDAHGTPIQLANADELYGAKKVTETCAKIAYDDDMGVRRNFFRDPKATQKAVKAVTLAPPEDLTPLIQAFQNGTLTNAAVIAHVKNHVNKNYEPGVEKVRLGMEALERADPTATLAAIDHAQLYRQLADGALTDAHGTPIQLANAGELNGAKKVTETCAKIAYDDDMGVRRNFFRDPKATQKAVKAVTLAPPEDLTPLIQAFQNGTLTNAAVIAHVKNHVNKDYQPGVEKVRLGMEALERADPTATLAAIDHAQLYRQLADGALIDAHGTPIQLANAGELYGAKKVTETCAKIAYDDDMGVRRNFFRDPKATQKAVKAVTLAPPEDLTPLIQAFQNGTLTNAAVIAHVKNHVNKNYEPGVEKVRLGMEALERADPTATLAAIDHAQLYRQLADGALTDAHGTPIQLANADELYGAKKVTETCAKIAYDDDMGVRRNFFRDPKATQKAVKAVTLAPPEDLTPLIQAFQNGTLTNAAVIAHVKNHVNAAYQPGVEKVRLGMEALGRADPTATLAAIDHAQLYRQLADGALTDAHGTPIQLANAGELYGAKKVTETCAKIAYDDDMGGVVTYLQAADATRTAVAAVKNPWLLSSKGKGKDPAPDLSVTRTNIEEIPCGEDDQAMDAEGFPLVELQQAMDASRWPIATSSFAQGSGSSMLYQPGTGAVGSQWNTSTSSGIKRTANEELSSHHSKRSREGAASSSGLAASYAALTLANELRPEDALSGVSDRQTSIKSLQSIVDLQGTEENRQTESYKSSYYEIKNTLLDPNNTSIVSALEEDLRGQGKTELFELLQAMKESVTARHGMNWSRSSWEITDPMAIEESRDVPQNAPMRQGIHDYQAPPRGSYTQHVASDPRSRDGRYPSQPGQPDQVSPHQGR